MKNQWYENLNKPELTPPDWVFAPVWTMLYILIGLSLWFYIKDGVSYSQVMGLVAFAIQLGLNLSWSNIFFGYHDIYSSFGIILLMWIFIFLNIILFAQYSKLSAFLLIPYFLWVTFAVYLNYEILVKNLE